MFYFFFSKIGKSYEVIKVQTFIVFIVIKVAKKKFKNMKKMRQRIIGFYFFLCINVLICIDTSILSYLVFGTLQWVIGLIKDFRVLDPKNRKQKESISVKYVGKTSKMLYIRKRYELKSKLFCLGSLVLHLVNFIFHQYPIS